MHLDHQTRFPLILHTILNDAVEQNFEHIISWVPKSNNLFKIHDSKAFERFVMKRYLKHQNHFKSFSRQLNIYGFERISTGSNYDPIAPRGAYHHPLFIRGKIDLAMDMDRPKARNGRLFQEKLNKEKSIKCQSNGLPSPAMTAAIPNDTLCQGSFSPMSQCEDVTEDIIYIFGRRIVALSSE